MDAGTKVTYFDMPATVGTAPADSQDPPPEGCVWLVFDDPDMVPQWATDTLCITVPVK